MLEPAVKRREPLKCCWTASLVLFAFALVLASCDRRASQVTRSEGQELALCVVGQKTETHQLVFGDGAFLRLRRDRHARLTAWRGTLPDPARRAWFDQLFAQQRSGQQGPEDQSDDGVSMRLARVHERGSWDTTRPTSAQQALVEECLAMAVEPTASIQPSALVNAVQQQVHALPASDARHVFLKSWLSQVRAQFSL